MLLAMTAEAENTPCDFPRATKMLSQRKAGMLKNGFQIIEDFINAAKLPTTVRTFLFAVEVKV